jgi:hypothetical protein
MESQMTSIEEYNNSHDTEYNAICSKLYDLINDMLKNSQAKLYHGAPVWFLDENPIVGYSKKKTGIALLFWSGQSFSTNILKPIGNFKASELVFSKAIDIDESVIEKLINESKIIIWDYKNIRNNNGDLKRIG